MIKGLRRKLTLLVIAVLVLVTAGIVLSTDLANRRNIASAAQKALQTLADNEGRRPGLAENQPAPPDGESEDLAALDAIPLERNMMKSCVP